MLQFTVGVADSLVACFDAFALHREREFRACGLSRLEGNSCGQACEQGRGGYAERGD